MHASMEKMKKIRKTQKLDELKGETKDKEVRAHLSSFSKPQLLRAYERGEKVFHKL